jgi:hypothetical protein
LLFTPVGELGYTSHRDAPSDCLTPVMCRHDERFKLSGVPTFAHIKSVDAPAKLLGPELESAPTAEAAAEVVGKFIDDTKDA